MSAPRLFVAEMRKLFYFCVNKGFLQHAQLDDCIRLAAEEDWAKGAALFLRMKEQFFKEKTIEERYSFDAFE